MSEVDIFLIGVPKAGTTWLANTLNQHKEIILSDPKEPNIIASHKGTFIRQNESPDWEKLCVAKKIVSGFLNAKSLSLDGV